jgi:membrane dipeptidase
MRFADLCPLLLIVTCVLGGAMTAERTWGAEPSSERPPIVLTDEAEELHRSCLLIDGHNDLPWELRERGSVDFSKLDISQLQPELHTDIPRLRKGGMGAQFWSVYVPVSYGYQGTALGSTIEQIELVKNMVSRYPNDFALAMTTDEIRKVRETGRIASLIGVEGGHCIEESLSNLENLYNLGARYMTLTHSDSLSWADAATDDEKNGGLSEFGREVVRTMNRLGMLVDLSHVSPATMHDALDESKAPVIFSHSSARAVADVARNVPDDVLLRLKELDGVVMVNFYSGFVVPEAGDIYKQRMELRRQLQKEYDADEVDRRVRAFVQRTAMPRGSIHDVLDHIMHMVEVAGAEHVGIGSDFDGIQSVPVQLEDVSTYPLLTQGMLDRGLTPDQIRGILGENLMRVMEKTEQVARDLQSQ